MKKNVLALSIATMIGGLGFAGIASANTLANTDGLFGYSPGGNTVANDLQLGKAGDKGHILVVPYFTAQDGNMSVFHVVNTDTQNAKAVKVRFRGASNSDDILDFQVFLSPGDVWTASVSQGAGGTAELRTSDTSCTVPAIPVDTPIPFVTDRLNPSLGDDALKSETREGYVELFTMADIPKNYSANATGTLAGKSNALYATVKHPSSGGAPACDSAVLQSTAVSGNLSNITSAQDAIDGGYDTPTGSLFGDWYIINVPQTTTFSGAATVVRAVDLATGALARGNFVHYPQLAGVVGQSETDNNTADPLFRGPNQWWNDAAYAGAAQAGAAALQASNYDLPDLSTPYANAVGAPEAPRIQAGLLTFALQATSVTNQYATDSSISARTDWVFSMPTRRYSVAYDYSVAANSRTGLRFTKLMDPAGVVYDNSNGDQWFKPDLVTVSNDQICVEAAGQSFWDREERTLTSGAVFSPGQVSKLSLCGETSVLSIAPVDVDSVLGAAVAARTVAPSFVNGWATVAFKGRGLPVQGFAATKLQNPNTGNGVSGTYGITWAHR